jgi:PAS domain S-box-containing protein
MTFGATILAVDDTDVVLNTLVRILEKAGYVVRAETNGESALAAALEGLPDLILLDVRMNAMDGLEVCRRLKANPNTESIPIILVSAFADVSEWVEGLRLGAADYITKPFQPVELLTRVKTHLTLRKATRSLEQQAVILSQTNAKLRIEANERLLVETELRQSLEDAKRAHQAMFTALENHERATKALRQSEEKFRYLFEASSDAMMTLEPPDWHFVSANPAAISLFRAKNIAEFFNCTPVAISSEQQHQSHFSSNATQIWQERSLRSETANFEWICRRLDGTEFPATISLTRMGWNSTPSIQATIRDVSASKQQEAEYAHNHKLEAVGQLAAGIAHEINTPAQFVGDGLHFLKEAFDGYQRLLKQYRAIVTEMQTQPEQPTWVKAIATTESEIDLAYLDENVPGSFNLCIDGVARIATIVRAMKEFAHPDSREMEAADLNQALTNALTIAKSEYKYVADVETNFGRIPPVICHIGDISQVFLNLIVNAADAIREAVAICGGRGVIGVSTRNDGAFVKIEVSDTGAGVPPSIRQRIFDPFFTTKEVGRGSGQGLAISRSIVVVKHHGTLTFNTSLGEGTTFTIRLPIDGSSVKTSMAPT